MLDTENEYYDSRRAYVNAERLHSVAYARALAGAGSLVSALELGNALHPMELPEQGKEETPDMYAVCPPEPEVTPAIDKEAIFREAVDKQGDLQRYMSPASASPALVEPGQSAPADSTEPAKPAGW